MNIFNSRIGLFRATLWSSSLYTSLVQVDLPRCYSPHFASTCHQTKAVHRKAFTASTVAVSFISSTSSTYCSSSSHNMDSHLPVFAGGEVIRGFGRGSKELGIPTANFPDDVVDALPAEIKTGIFFGWAMIDVGPIYPMVVSIGEKGSVEGWGRQ